MLLLLLLTLPLLLLLLLLLQRVIKSDVERTRARLAVFRQTKTRKLMEQMLTFYCKSQALKYKQGLNELLGKNPVQQQQLVLLLQLQQQHGEQLLSLCSRGMEREGVE